MAYKALYRKYRPETFEDVVGQKHIIQTLKNAIISNKVAHAYIFSGPRGTGKTTTAKLLAKALNCSDDVNNRPCNHCENCKAINEGSHPDIIEIDAASNNGVDEIRDLIEKVKYAPIQGRYKIYIIDEVHMMTAGAFNALLKTLEEPPAHVVFILATTDVHKVLPTVLSRCQRFDFSKIEFDDLKKRIVDVLQAEGITFDENVPSLVSELADGGMRDALSILDQVVSYAGEHISLQHVYDIYGMMGTQDMVKYLTYLANGNTKNVLDLIEQYIGKGIDVKRLTYDLMICLKDAIVYRSTNDESVLERLNQQTAEELLKNYTIESALKVTDILNEARNHYRLSTNYRLFFELASLKAIEALNTKAQEIIPQQTIQKVEESVKKIVEEPKEIKIETPQIINTNETIVKNVPSHTYDVPKESEMITYSLDEYVNILCQGDKKVKEKLNEQWKKIHQYINNPAYRYIAQLLVDSKIGVANKEFVLIVFDFKIIANKAKQRNNIILIRQFLNEIFGIDVEVYVVENSTFIDMTNKFFELRQANKLPKLHPLPHLGNEVEEKEEVIDATIEIGKDLFGDDLIIK